MANNGEKEKLTEAEQAIADGRICAKCKFHLPPVALHLFNQQQSRLVGSGRKKTAAIAAVLCGNPKSDKFQSVLGLR